ncbi:fad binding domain-containing [Trichoderma arundinaceum]|uniref:Fad binding domain-containing n=1 Tax=Trichoderma arundinaceum TaxID=490622 RepID=A0A395NW18_TRIAR|nr:fad binding domain-containing [Trichoderma arundinaceum]
MRSVSRVLALVAIVGTCLSSTAAATKEAAQACHWITKLIPGYVDYPNSTQYEIDNTYWSQQQRAVHPHCFVRPSNATEVGAIMRVLVRFNSTFNVKSGGFSPFAGASNVEGGVTIDLGRMNKTKEILDGSTMSAGPAARYYGLYRYYDNMKNAGMGPKNGDLTVAGYVLGCGFTFFPQNSGFACDNVNNYELVTVKGDIIRVNRKVNPELFSAIRGGGASSFGIVTRFDIVRFWQKKTWWNHLQFPASLNSEVMDVYGNLSLKGHGFDLFGHSFLISTYSEDYQDFVTDIHIIYTEYDFLHYRMPGIAEPFQRIRGALKNVTEVNGAANFSSRFNEPPGNRYSSWSTSVAVDKPEFLTEILANWQVLDRKLKGIANVNQSDFKSVLEFQPVSRRMLWNMRRHGHNAWGITTGSGPMMFVLLSLTWTDPTLDRIIEVEARRYIDNIDNTAKQIDQYRGFIHMNYAHPSQDVFGRFNPQSIERLRHVAKMYDPDGALHRLWRGYFKLNRVDV